mmetsp:Transcript_19486/g.45058  ORF Transcript_19486/g.45058 Transcript_19486/m.45058 type:complete len:214 (+) Transcript_19486:347-988(+)
MQHVIIANGMSPGGVPLNALDSVAARCSAALPTAAHLPRRARLSAAQCAADAAAAPPAALFPHRDQRPALEQRRRQREDEEDVDHTKPGPRVGHHPEQEDGAHPVQEGADHRNARAQQGGALGERDPLDPEAEERRDDECVEPDVVLLVRRVRRRDRHGRLDHIELGVVYEAPACVVPKERERLDRPEDQRALDRHGDPWAQAQAKRDVPIGG